MIHLGGPAQRTTLRSRELRRDSREPHGERVLRLQEGSLHRRRGRSRRILPGREQRHAVSRRSGRPSATDAGEAPPRHPGKEGAQGRRTTEEPVDVRIISATHKKLPALVDAGEFRQDLFYRLHVIELAMPSLREMREDIPSIADAILKKLARGTPAKLDPQAATALEAYPFPGNVRELENILERGLSLAADSLKITAEDLHLTPPPRRQTRRCPRETSGHCRIIWTGSSASPSTRRWKRRATTARRRPSCWGLRSERCATEWSGWGSSNSSSPFARHSV